MVLGWRMRIGIVRMRMWTVPLKLLVAPVLTFGTNHPYLLP